ncbi:MAG: penicillin acylase family protein [Dehalococcoidia bacterium]|nr:penicillin acylase family protein [Dehalococcoidia bacterium]
MKRIIYLIIVSLLVMGLVLTGCPPTNGVQLETIDIAAIPGVTPPVTGGTPVTAITPTAQYTGDVSWNPDHGTFEPDTAYSAIITLEAEEGYTFTGVPANFFTVTGATATNAAGSSSVIAEFPATEPPEPSFAFTIIRDDFGVPHVYADTKESLAYGAGYAMAQDRLWQADILRRSASGRLAEFLGPNVLGQDKELRALWYNQQELQEIYDNWDPGAGYEHLKPMIEAYVEGINLFIDEALEKYFLGDFSVVPVEYIAQGLISKLEHFTVADVVAVTVLMAWRFGGTGGNEGDIYTALLTLQAMHGEQLGGAVWSDLFPLNDAGAPVTIPDQVFGEATATAMTVLDFPDNLGEVFEEYAESRAAQDELLESLGIPARFGSNALPVRPELSATGNALQLGGPQMGYSVPQIVLEIGLHGAGINAVGMAFPSAGPFILIGVSEYGAWTSTTGASDVMDVRVLGLNPDNPTQYFYDGGWRDMEPRTETFHVRGLDEPVTETFYRSHYGPIVKMDIDGGMAFTLHTPFYKNEIGAEQGWQLFQEATNIDEFEAAVELIWPSHNFLWADVEGNIGYWHAGRFPVKPEGADRRLPLKGDGSQEWVRVTEPEEMPRSINPEQGWLTNWNNKPIANWPYAESDFHWGEGHRVSVLMQTVPKLLFVTEGNLTVEHLNQVNQVGGYHHTAGMSFAGPLIGVLTAYAGANPGDTEVAGALSYLAAWATAQPLPVSYVDFDPPSWPADPNPTYDHVGLTIFDAWYDRIVPKVFDGILPADLIGRVKGSPSLLIRILREDESLLYPLYPKGEALNALVVDALKEAIDDLKGQYGEDMSAWLTPVRMQTYDQMGGLPAINPQTGQPWHPRMNRGTYNHIAELSSPLPQGKSVIPLGQSGLLLFPGVPSLHAFDQIALYASWNYKPMYLTRSALEAVQTWQREFIIE